MLQTLSSEDVSVDIPDQSACHCTVRAEGLSTCWTNDGFVCIFLVFTRLFLVSSGEVLPGRPHGCRRDRPLPDCILFCGYFCFGTYSSNSASCIGFVNFPQYEDAPSRCFFFSWAHSLAQSFAGGLFTESGFVLAEGSYSNSVFKVQAMGLPPLEPATETLWVLVTHESIRF